MTDSIFLFSQISIGKKQTTLGRKTTKSTWPQGVDDISTYYYIEILLSSKVLLLTTKIKSNNSITKFSREKSYSNENEASPATQLREVSGEI